MVRPSNRKVNMLTGSIPHCLDSLVNPLPLEIPYSLTPLLSVVSKNSMNYAIIQCNLFNVRGLEGPDFLQGFESRIFSPYYFLLYLMVCSHCPTSIKMGRAELCGGVYTTQRTTQILIGFCVNFLAYVFVSVFVLVSGSANAPLVISKMKIWSNKNLLKPSALCLEI